MGYPTDYTKMNIPDSLAKFITHLIKDMPDKDSITYKSNEQATRIRWKLYAIAKQIKDTKGRTLSSKYELSVKGCNINARRKEDDD